MEEKQSKFDNKEESRFLLSFHSKTGILYFLTLIGDFLLFIGFLCPFLSYNPTVVDDLKRTVSFFETGWAAYLAFFVWWGAFLLSILVIFVIAKSDWKTKFSKITGMFIGYLVAVVVSFIFLLVAALLYEVPESSFSYLSTDFAAGAYLIFVGEIIGVVCYSMFYGLLRDYAKGKIQCKDLDVGKKSQTVLSGNDDNSATTEKTLDEKLRELQKLKNDGLISEEEFEEKKAELLNEYH